MYNITYFLGAGASCNAIPAMNSFNSSILNFLYRLRNDLKDEPVSSTIENIWLPLIRLATEHASIDTFAKKLFLTGDENNLWQLKIILSAYFIYEQALENDKDQTAGAQNYPRFNKRPIDPRYDFFMAALLRPYKLRALLPENVKIITWNYDSQLEMSYHPYGKIGHNEDNALREALKIYPRPGIEYNQSNSLSNDINIVKLNGTAALLFSEKGDSIELKSYRKLFYSEAISEIVTLINYSKEKINHPHFTNHGSNINFAWELNGNWLSQMAVESAKEIISNTNILVIIGYSFPVFNREIDKYIFEDNPIQKVYIQDVKTNINGVQSRASTIMNLSSDNFELDPNVDQFLIPFEL